MGNICGESSSDGLEKKVTMTRDKKLSDSGGIKASYTTVDGHTGMNFKGKTLTKVTKESEAKNYMKIFDYNAEESLVKLRTFLPEFYGATEDPEATTKHKWKI